MTLGSRFALQLIVHSALFGSTVVAQPAPAPTPPAAGGTSVKACVAPAKTECIDMENCVVNIEGANYDLGGTQDAGGNKATGAGDYDYYVNFCQGITKLPGASCSGSVDDCAGSSCSVFQLSKDGSVCYAAGVMNTLEASFLDPSTNIVGKPASGITLTQNVASSGREFVTRLICDSSSGDPGRGIELGKGSGKYQVFWNTPYGCPDRISAGTWFLIFFGGASVMYVVGGFFLLKRSGKAESIPNAEFWTDVLPDLVKDGIYFTMERVGGMKTGTAGYEEIKHQSQGEEL